jgi:hypothetical protein
VAESACRLEIADGLVYLHLGEIAVKVDAPKREHLPDAQSHYCHDRVDRRVACAFDGSEQRADLLDS